MKIKIYTGVTAEPKKCLFDDLHPKFQIFNFRQLIEQGEDFKLTTNSDFIIRELNYFITEGIIKTEDVEFFEDEIKIEASDSGFESISIDAVIEEQNIRCEESYYNMKYGNT